MNIPYIEQFLTKVEILGKNKCWLWRGTVINTGYGQFWNGEKLVSSHRYSYEYFIGAIGDKFVLHKCDNPLCVRPSHLFLGTDQDNTRDKVAKGRHHRKLSDVQVIEIINSKEHPEILATKYGVSRATIYNARMRITYSHIAIDMASITKNGSV